MSQIERRQYDDTYPTCIETYSTLRIFSDDLPPNEITSILNVQPTETFHKGDLHALGRLRRKANGWFYSTERLSDSKDFRRHLDMILDVLEGRVNAIEMLRSRMCQMDITTFWVSIGQGGPWLMPDQMLKLGTLGIELWFDVYWSDENEERDLSPSK